MRLGSWTGDSETNAAVEQVAHHAAFARRHPRIGPVAAGADRTFTIAGACGVPGSARAVSLNVTVTGPTSAGNVRVFPAGSAVPDVSMLNYSAGQTRANNLDVGLGTNGDILVDGLANGSVQAIFDVVGWFE